MFTYASIGTTVIVNPVGSGGLVSGALAPAEGPLTGIVVSVAHNNLTGEYFGFKVKLNAPGLSNHNRVVIAAPAERR
jgi:hypothetical protein